jgi:hypothetical protein
MVLKNLIILFGVTLWLMVVCPAADVIILKDGKIVESDTVWETERYIHFILKGTKNVEIRYSKTIVDRIIKDSEGEKKEENQQQEKEKRIPSAPNRMEKTEGSVDELQHSLKPIESVREKKADLQQSAKSTSGTGFYDPRRPLIYWAATNSRHSTLNAALESLAQQYERSTQWVVTHMGLENDLRAIHQNLLQQIKREKLNSQNTSDGNLVKRPQLQPAPAPNNISDTRSGTGPGILFYDPRRPDKYWTGPTAHYNTLEAAIDALAAQYGVDAVWIGDHMGSTNDLTEIHNTIQQNLENKLNQKN